VTDVRKVIEDLVWEYIGRLYGESFLEHAGDREQSSSECNEEKSKIVVMLPENAYGELKLPEYLEKLQKKSKVECISDLEGAGTYGRIALHMKLIEQIDLFSPDIELLENLVEMRSSYNKLIKLVLEALLQGKLIKIIVPYYNDTQNLVQETYNKLLQKAELLGCEIQYLDSTNAKKEKAAFQSILLEEDIVHALKNGTREITVSAGCIITPLANDKIRETNINIKRTRPV